MNVLGIKMNNPQSVQAELAKRNWYVSKSRYPSCLRIVVMPHVTKTVIDNFLPEFESVCRALGEL
jgi:tyrosine decarboxylase/aspartate 1-decarboxylase